MNGRRLGSLSRAVAALALIVFLGAALAQPPHGAAATAAEAPAPAAAPRGEGPALPCRDVLYVSTGNTNASGGGRIYRVTIDDAQITLVGNTGLDRLGAIDFDASGRLYGVSGGSTGPGSLYEFNPANAAVIGAIGDIVGVSGIDSIAFDAAGALWGAAYNGSGGALVTLNPANAALLTNVALSGDAGNNFCPGMAFDPGGRLFLSRGNASGRTCDLAENVPLGSGTIVPIGPATNVISDIWVNSLGTMYGCSPDGFIYLIDQDTGAKTALVGAGLTLSGMTGIDGCCPAPVAPFGPSPAHDSTGVGLSSPILSWNNPPGGGPLEIASPRSAVVFENRPPSLYSYVDATLSRAADDFVVSGAAATIGAVRFWTAENSLAAPWDGACEWQICEDSAGEPGPVVDSGLAAPLRTFTGRNFGDVGEPDYLEYEYRFDLPAPLTLAQGTYWLTLHLSADCATFDDIHWETAAGDIQGAPSASQPDCVDAWGANFQDLAFQLLGPDDDCCNVLYAAATGVAGDGAAPSSLYRIDPATGAWELVGPIGFSGVSGLSFHPITGVLYGSCIDPGTGRAALITVNPDTGAGSYVGPISVLKGTQFRVPDISFRSDGTLFGYGDSPDRLLTINTAQGFAIIVGSTGFGGGGNGMDFAPSGRLFATPFDTGCLVELDPSTGAGVCITPNNVVPNRVNALEFCPDTGVLYGAYNADNFDNWIITIDTVTGEPTSFAETVPGLDAIAFRCPINQCDVEYDVFFGLTPNGGDPVCLGVTDTFCAALPTLQPDTTYYWQVLCRGPGGEVLGPNWSFTTGPPCLGDINGDGLRNTADLGLLLAAFSTSNPAADLNDDEIVNTADLGLLLGVFGIPCP